MSAHDYQIRITHQAEKDVQKLTPKLKQKLYDILMEAISKNPFQGKKLIGDLERNYSYRLTFQDRIVYSIDQKKRIVYIKRARTHYGD